MPDVVVYTFNPNTWKTEASRSSILRLFWSKEQISGQPSLGNEGSHQNQKADEYVIEQEGHVPAPARSRTLHIWQPGSGFRVKNEYEELWNLLPRLRKAAEFRCVTGCPYMEAIM